MKPDISVQVLCEICDLKTEVSVWIPVPAKNTRGRIEDSEPPFDGYYEPDECSHCGEGFSQDDIFTQAEEELNNY